MRLPRQPGTLDPELDARLVKRCLEGDPRAWEALVRRHERLVYAVGRSWRLDEDDLGDVFQEVFAALVRGLPRLRDGRSLVRWLSSTTERVARTTALRRRRELANTDSEPGALDDAASDQPEVGLELEQLERQAVVRGAIAGLSERCRRLIQALYYEDPAPAYADLSRRLGVPVGSLGPTRARCMEKLKSLLDSTESGGSIRSRPGPTSSTREAASPPPRRARHTRPDS